METTGKSHARKHPRKLHFMREWRIERDMTQEALAKAIGSTKSLVSRYEAGTVGMSLSLIFLAIEALNIGIEEFFDHPKHAKKTPARLRAIQRLHRRLRGELDEE